MKAIASFLDKTQRLSGRAILRPGPGFTAAFAITFVLSIGVVARLARPVLADDEGAGRNSSKETTEKQRQRALPEVVSFNAHIRPIMSNTCFACHGPDEETNKSGLRLDAYEFAVESAIVPGESDESLVYQRLVDEDDPMPPADFRHHLTEYDKALFKRWIDQGAKYEKHWSYSELTCPPVPDANRFSDEAINPIDHFIFARLEQEGLEPSPLADKATLLRRLSLDLTGLPPTIDELNTYLSDTSAEAYEKQVDRLLASQRYGERMATPWLDIVRFSDTVGYHGDQNQRIFPYRDYVIRSINENQPFDQFTLEQLAGDLLENPTEQQLVATGLIRLNMMTREGGAQPAEYLAKYTADRVRMLGTAWLGSTTGCCECHNHKYDPFTSKDFYSLGAFFDDVRQWGVYTTYGYTPNPDLAGFSNVHPFPPELRVKSPSLQAQIDQLEHQLNDAAAGLAAKKAEERADVFASWLARVRDWVQQNPTGWQSLTPDKVESSKKSSIELDGDTVLITGEATNNDDITFSYTADRPINLRTVQLEVLPDAKHGGHIGRGKDGRFSADLSLRIKRQDAAAEEPVKLQPRFIRVELNADRPLSLAEVEVFASDQESGKPVNIASSGKASQSTTDYEGAASRAIDGITNGNYRAANSVTHTKHGQPSAWWELDLQKTRDISRIAIWNRTDHDYGSRIKDYKLVLLDEDRNRIWETSPAFPDPSTSIKIPTTRAELQTQKDLAIELAHADRKSPRRYSSGRDPRTLSGAWRSGPAVWQLPTEETSLPHTALYHLQQTSSLEPGDQLVIKIKSGDIGRFRLSISPLSRWVAGDAIASETFRGALDQSRTATSHPALLSAYYFATTSSGALDAEVRRLRDAILDCQSGYALTMVAQPVPADRVPEARVLPRGNWQDRTGEVVTPAVPSFLPSSHSTEKRLTRVDLAKWLTSQENPLVARHYVNRTWKLFFGTGLSNKLDDLGNQGEWPSHPLLLDWLACQFRADWDRKAIVRLIVTSRAYRQQAAVRNDLREIDPYNRLLAEQSARRLGAESIRDNALSISGLLDIDFVGGPSVFPYQPAGHYANLQFPNRTYVSSQDRRQYRRGVYMHWQRTFLHPMLVNFDAPSRDECVADRTLSNSPQQALTLLNDPSFVETARAFATRLDQEVPQGTFESKLQHAYRLALARDATTEELAGLKQFYETQLRYYEENPSDTEAFESVGMYSPDQHLQSADHAAWSQVCRVILNLHETITRF